MLENILNKFTKHYKKTIVRAYGLSLANQKKTIGVEEIFWALVAEKGSLGAETLAKAGFHAGLETDLGANQVDEWEKILAAKEETSLAEEAQKIIIDSAAIATKYQHGYIGTEHLLYSLLKAEAKAIDPILRQYKIASKKLLSSLEQALDSTSKFEEMTGAIGELKEKIKQEEKRHKAKRETLLDFFGTELTNPQNQKNIMPVIGRETEIKRVIQILARRNKNNPVLLGEPGVGKTAIVEGLAKKITQGEVPAVLLDKKIYALDMPLLVAGTSYRGEFEGRLKQIVEEAKMNPDIILFIDEIHNIVGAGAAGGTMDAANILKPALARGEIRCIGATTFDDYKKHIETDSALARRLQKVTVEEPSPEEAIAIIKGIAPIYEKHHQVQISDEAIREAVRLSVRYLTEQFLPDKAIDLIDEAASKIRMEWPIPDNVKQVSQIKKELRILGEGKNTLVNEGKYQEALAAKEREFTLISQLYGLESAEIKSKVKNKQTAKSAQLTGEDIRQLVAESTKIHISDNQKMIGGLTKLTAQLKEKIIGQDQGLEKIVKVLKRSAAGLAGNSRPLGSFIFAGPSGVGKTYTAKILAEALNPKGNGLIRLDMSEYGEKFNASKIIGAPAGYVGYDEGGLTEKVRRNPYAVILLDEMEKAHPDIFNLWLSVLEDGQLTDSRGRVINFRNTIIIMTTNAGLKKRTEGQQLGFGEPVGGQDTKIENHNYQESLEELLRPEFLNRVDQLVIFNPLAEKDIAKIIDLNLADINNKLAPQKLRIEWSDKVVKKLLQECQRRGEGARIIREVIRQEIEDALAEEIIGQRQHKDGLIKIGLVNNNIKFN